MNLDAGSTIVIPAEAGASADGTSIQRGGAWVVVGPRPLAARLPSP